MLGRKNYSRDEIDHGKAVIKAQLATFKTLSDAITDAADRKSQASLGIFEPQFFNNLALALDRLYVHRVRLVTGRDNNALNEVELICESLMNNGGVFSAGTVVKYNADQAVVKLKPGDKIVLGFGQFDKLAEAFFAELERRFL
jgi:anthranilate phosphoribosyltransferase